jgi:hypothetical protein
MYISAGVVGVATFLPVLEPRVQSHYFLDTPLRMCEDVKVPVAVTCLGVLP